MNTLQNLVNLLKKIGITNQKIGEQFTSNSTTLTLGQSPVTGSVSLFYAGLRLSGDSFSVSDKVITLKAPFPVNTDDIILVDYQWQ